MPKYLWAQPFLTWLTAAPSTLELNGWDGRSAPHPVTHLFSALLKLVLGVTSGHLGFQLLFGPEADRPGFAGSLIGAMLLATGWLLSTSAFRKMQVVIYHNCAHNMMFRSKRGWNALLGNLISGVVVLKNFNDYRKAHLAHHDGDKLMTTQDDTWLYLTEQIGIKRTDSIEGMWRKLILTILSPLYHLRTAIGRANSCFFTSHSYASWCALGCWSIVVYLLYKRNALVEFAIVWLVPAFVLYQISVALRLCAEHRLPHQSRNELTSKDFVALSTTSVFMGEAYRQKATRGAQLVELLRWTFVMMTVHLFFRLFVMVGDTPCHDYHHRRAASHLWTNYAYARARDKRDGCQGFRLNYLDSWGLVATITSNFKSFSLKAES